LSAAAQVEAVTGGRAVAFTGGQGDGRGSAPAGELGFAAEAGRVADLDQQTHRGDRPDTAELGQGAAQIGEQRRDLRVEAFDAGGDGVDVDEWRAASRT
jgi:hypothetical protein